MMLLYLVIELGKREREWEPKKYEIMIFVSSLKASGDVLS